MIKEIEEIEDEDGFMTPFVFENEYKNKLIRLNINKYHYDKLIDIVRESGDDELLEALESRKSVVTDININKVEAMEKATEVRVAKAKKNIKLAFEYLVRNDKKVTQKAIAEISKCSVNTVRKYDYIWKYDAKDFEAIKTRLMLQDEKERR